LTPTPTLIQRGIGVGFPWWPRRCHEEHRQSSLDSATRMALDAGT
jgi:hypothetical protein